MALRDYPRLGNGDDMRRQWGHQLVKQRGGPPLLIVNESTSNRCFVCGGPATRITVIQVSFMRGEDESESTCEAHRKDLAAILAKWKERK